MTLALGYKLSSEEQSPADLVRYAQMAEDTGFEFALISDHYHPWIDRQGQSPFVWSVLGAIAQATRRLVVGTAVTCPTMRLHPAIVAQAAANDRRADARPLLSRRRHRREPERARRRRDAGPRPRYDRSGSPRRSR
jgi:hypothetical protein